MSKPGFAGNSYILDINGSGGAFTAVVARSTVRQLVIQESQLTSTGAANALQRIIDYQIPNDGTPNGFTTIFRQAEDGTVVTIEQGSPVGQRGPWGEIIGQLGQPIIGQPNGQLTTATTMIKLRSGTATGTSVLVTELN
jgi:hypothetical protein